MRNAGGNLKVSTTDQTYSQVVVRTQVEVFRCPNSIGCRPMTARNCGVIAPGNHWILDSLRGAPPPGEAMGAAAPIHRVGAALAVVPVPTMNGGGAAASRPPYGDGSQNHDKMCCVILYKML